MSIPVWGNTQGGTLGDARGQAGGPVDTFDTLASKRRKEVRALAEDVGTFLREELGHARAFVIDTDEAIRGRAALVKAL
jgi:hypothetical protein